MIRWNIFLVLLSYPFYSSGYVLSIDGLDSLIIAVDEAPIKVELYYESLCPGCRNFITTMLYPAWEKLKDTGIMKVELYPYGNAHQTQNKNGTWEFDCQHGDKECLGNILEVCVMKNLAWDSSLYLPVISCMEGADDPIESARGCVSALSKISYSAVKTCAQGSEGNQLEHDMGARTESLDPPHNYVPWIVVDGKHTDELQEAAQTNLVGLVCSLYQGQKPTVCKNQSKLALDNNAVEIELEWA